LAIPAKPDKREAILEAMLDLIVERGFHDAPMSVLAKRSRASPGVIYHYFPSKDHLIHALYLRIKSIKHQSLFEGCVPGMDPHHAFIHVWTNAYRFYRHHLRETRFLDQYENSPFACAPNATGKTSPEPVAEADALTTEFMRLFRSRKRGGLLNDLPPDVVHELTLGLASRLAKKAKPLSRATLSQVAETAWKAITEN
jgi:TetR/AcrR family transcriptional regulator, repressor of fatR-cypB operon